MRTITGTTTAWLTSYANPDCLQGKGDVTEINFADQDMTQSGWTRLGPATISFECPDEKVIIANKVIALQGELQTVRAKAQEAVNALEDKIQSLLALTFEAST